MPGRKRRGDPPYDCEHIILPGGERFDIPEGGNKDYWIEFFEEVRRATLEVYARHGDGLPADGINRASILPDSSHRDGSIYSGAQGWQKDCRISETNETELEPMVPSNPRRCYPDQQSCIFHTSKPMMQIYSMTLATVSAQTSGPVQLYGYIAARDKRDGLRNYVFNRSRDNPVMLEPGALIEMTGPKRGISMQGDALIEYDLKIKKEEDDDDNDDIQLIDGVSDFDQLGTPARDPFLSRIDGPGGAVDITLAMFYKAVEATIQIDSTHIKQSGFDLLLKSCVSGLDEEIQLFCGDLSQLPARFVVSTMEDTWMRLKFKFGGRNNTDEFEYCASFKGKHLGCSSEEIKLVEGYIIVKVTWATFK